MEWMGLLGHSISHFIHVGWSPLDQGPTVVALIFGWTLGG
jgi:hypothetical protein